MPARSHLGAVYAPDFGLLTDLYQLTMAAGYHRHGLHRRSSIFHLFYRSAPFGGRLAISAGLPLAMDLIEGLRFSADDVQYLGRLTGNDGRPLFTEPFLNYLQRLRFSGSVDAIPEGEIALPHEPLLRIEAPLVEAQLLETALLTVVNFSTLIATKAARIRAAAGEDTVLEFGLRRAQGIDGGLTASRAAYLGGCDATSNVWAGRYYGIPVRGTHAHSWVMVFPDEMTAFEAYAAAMPANAVFLVDTFDTLEGTRRAIAVARELRDRGHELVGIRLDSGNLAELSTAARRMLDAAGFPEAAIVASDSLDEHRIRELKAAGARIGVWGIGTRLATAHDQPALGGVYKLAAVADADGRWQPKIKLSNTPIKTSNPGRLAVRRYADATGRPLASQLYDTLGGEPEPGIVDAAGGVQPNSGEDYAELLVPVYRGGEAVYDPPPLAETRRRAIDNWRRWMGLPDLATFPTGPDPKLYRQKADLIAAARNTPTSAN